jgi:hypothetical protein
VLLERWEEGRIRRGEEREEGEEGEEGRDLVVPTAGATFWLWDFHRAELRSAKAKTMSLRGCILGRVDCPHGVSMPRLCTSTVHICSAYFLTIAGPLRQSPIAFSGSGSSVVVAAVAAARIAAYS